MPGEIIPITFFIVVAVIVKIVSDNGIKRKLIAGGLVNENVQYLYSDRLNAAVPGSLKWGMVLVAVGLALLIAPDMTEFTLALMLIFGGAALIAYYIIGTTLLARKKDEA